MLPAAIEKVLYVIKTSSAYDSLHYEVNIRHMTKFCEDKIDSIQCQCVKGVYYTYELETSDEIAILCIYVCLLCRSQCATINRRC